MLHLVLVNLWGRDGRFRRFNYYHSLRVGRDLFGMAWKC